MPDDTRKKVERTQTFVGIKDIDTLTRTTDKELDEFKNQVNSIIQNISVEGEGAGQKTYDPPTAPVLSDGTLTPAPAAWGYVQHLDMGDDYWLRKNVPQYNAGASNSTGAVITVRLYHGGAGKYDTFLLDQTLRIAAFVAVYEYDPNTATYSTIPFFIPFIEEVTQIDSTRGYSDIEIASPRITVNDHIAIPIVAAFGQGGTAQTTYGDTEKSFVAGSGTNVPESPTLACTHKDIFYDDYTATFTRDYIPYEIKGTGTVAASVLTDLTKSWIVNIWAGGTLTVNGATFAIVSNTATAITVTGSPTTGSQTYTVLKLPTSPCCNFYETLEIWIQNLATDTNPRCGSTDPDKCPKAPIPPTHSELCWYLEKEKDLKPRIKRLKNKSESGNWKVKFRIQHPEHRHPRVAVRVLDKFGQLGEYNNHANDDESEGVKITALGSYKDDDGATQKIEYAVKLTVTKDSGAADPNTIRIKVVPCQSTAPYSETSKKFIQDFDYDSTEDGTYILDKHFKKGKKVSLYVKALYSGGLKSTNWIECLTSVSGYTSRGDGTGYYTVGGAVTAPDAIEITGAEREGKLSVITASIPNDSKIGAIQIWACPGTDNVDPNEYSAGPPIVTPGGSWKKVHQVEIEPEELNTSVLFNVNRPNAWKKNLAARAISCEDKTIKGPWHLYGTGKKFYSDDTPSVTMTFTGTRVNNSDSADIVTITTPVVYPKLAKVKARKWASGAWKLLPVIDTIDPVTDECEDNVFDVEVPHKVGYHPDVQIQLIDRDGNKTAWTDYEGTADAERLAGPQDNGNSITTAIKDAGRKVTLNYPGGVPANYSTVKVFCIAGATPPSWDRSSGEVGEWGSELVALGASYVKNIAKASNNLSVSFEVLQYYSGGSYHPFTAANDLACCFLVCLVDNSSPAVDGYWGFALRPGSTASFGTPEIVSITRGTGTATLVINYPSTGTPTSLGVVVRTLNPYAGATPANSPTTWASFSPQTYFNKATITGQAESGRKALTGSPMTIVVTGIVDTAVAFAVCVGIDGTGYGAWGLGYDAGSGGGGGGTPPTPVMENIGSTFPTLQFTWSDGNQYQVQVYYGSSTGDMVYMANSGGLVSSGWTKTVVTNKYYKARLERLSDGVLGEFCTAVKY